MISSCGRAWLRGYVDQVDKGMAPYGYDLTVRRIEQDIQRLARG